MKIPIALFAVLHILTPVLIKISEEFHEVGSSRLNVYTRADWMILAATCAALGASNALSFFSTKWSDYLKKKEGDTKPPFKI